MGHRVEGGGAPNDGLQRLTVDVCCQLFQSDLLVALRLLRRIVHLRLDLSIDFLRKIKRIRTPVARQR